MIDEQKWLEEAFWELGWTDSGRIAPLLAERLAEREREMRETIADLRRMVELCDRLGLAAPSSSVWKELHAKHFPAPRPEPKFRKGDKVYLRSASAVDETYWLDDKKQWSYWVNGHWVVESDLRPLREDER